LKYNPVSKVAIYGFTTPVCGAVLSSLVLNEGTIFSMKSLVALVLVCIGIFSVNYQKSEKKELTL
jgi:drug/metabolite transporter (DMT)-like permease